MAQSVYTSRVVCLLVIVGPGRLKLSYWVWVLCGIPEAIYMFV